MKIALHSDTEISVTRLYEAGIEFDNQTTDVHPGAVQLCVASLAWCTYSILASYGQRIEAGTDEMSVRLNWRYTERPHRIGHIDMTVHWPQVPETRMDAAMRAAAMCTLHNTLLHGVEIDTSIEH